MRKLFTIILALFAFLMVSDANAKDWNKVRIGTEGAYPPFNYVDVPIYDYLEELAARGENIRDYRTIWFYY